MNEHKKRELRLEVQKIMASTEMFDQPQGKIELTPAAQKAIDRYLGRRIAAAVTLLSLCAGVVGIFGHENIASVEERIGRIQERVENDGREARRLLDKFKADVEDYDNELKGLSDETTVAQTKLAAAIHTTETNFKLDVATYDEELGTLRESTQKAQASANEEAKAIGSYVKAEIERARERIKELRENFETDLGELEGLVKDIAVDPRFLGFVETQMTLNALPIGSIVAWHPQLLGLPKNAKPPEGWVRCDGGKISGGDLAGVNSPNLNDPNKDGIIKGYRGGAFLRGGTTSGVPKHATEIPRISGEKENNVIALETIQNEDRIRILGNKYSSSWKSFPENPGGDSMYATRPVNMSVVWIMRVK